MQRIVMLGLILVVGFLAVTPVLATELMDKTRADYQFQLDKYRPEYESFDIKRTQYQNVKTFAAQEEMAIAAKVVLLRRVGVWRAYIQMLKQELYEARGIDLTLRDSLVKRIDDWQLVLDSHSDRLNPLEKRDPLLEEARFLNSQGNSLQLDTYVALSHIKLAQVQSVLDAQTALTDKLVENVRLQIRDTVVRDSRLRGFEQVDQIHTLAQADLGVIKGKVEALEAGGYDAANKYQEIIADLAPVYQELRQSFSLMEELAQGLE